VGVERWPVHSLVASAAGTHGVSAPVAEAHLVADENLIRAELVSVRGKRSAGG
jgi:hypothetical protein